MITATSPSHSSEDSPAAAPLEQDVAPLVEPCEIQRFRLVEAQTRIREYAAEVPGTSSPSADENTSQASSSSLATESDPSDDDDDDVSTDFDSDATTPSSSPRRSRWIRHVLLLRRMKRVINSANNAMAAMYPGGAQRHVDVESAQPLTECACEPLFPIETADGSTLFAIANSSDEEEHKDEGDQEERKCVRDATVEPFAEESSGCVTPPLAAVREESKQLDSPLLTQLPLELMLLIMEFLPVDDVVLRVGCTSKYLTRIVQGSNWWCVRWRQQVTEELRASRDMVVCAIPLKRVVLQSRPSIAPCGPLVAGSTTSLITSSITPFVLVSEVASDPDEDKEATRRFDHHASSPEGQYATRPTQDLQQAQAALLFCERRMGCVLTRSRLQVRDNDEPRDNYDIDEQLLASNFAKGIQSASHVGLISEVMLHLESEPSFRRGVSLGTIEPGREGFGVLFPLYVGLGHPFADDAPRPNDMTAEQWERLSSHGYPYPLVPHVSTDGDGSKSLSPVIPLYHAHDLAVYRWLLLHTVTSDVRQFSWTDEQKFGVCCTLLGPSGRAVEFRLFTAALQGSYPRFFVKCVFCEAGAFPREEMKEVYCDKGKDLFTGGYGRVEVDISPRFNISGFSEMIGILGLREGFPMQLLWNVAVAATGAVSVLFCHMPSFLLYYDTTFVDAFALAAQVSLVPGAQGAQGNA